MKTCLARPRLLTLSSCGGYNHNMAPQANSALPAGFQLDQYTIKRQLSHGGFSIVYLAYDPTGTPVAIKEYLPNSLALRQNNDVAPKISAEHESAFRYGMKCFFEEGRSLARLKHPNVVRVQNFFRTNGTVYMVMAFEQGRTLNEYIHKHRGKVPEGFIRAVFSRTLNGLREVHSHKILHLDIKPANIYLRNTGAPVLLDFGAARQTLTSEQPMLKPMYTPGFASPEQYGKDRKALGLWSDLYSVGASMYACIVGHAPPRADERMQKDEFVPLAQFPPENYSPDLLATIDWCLRLDPLARPQSAYSLQKAVMQRGASDKLPAGLFANADERLRNFIDGNG